MKSLKELMIRLEEYLSKHGKEIEVSKAIKKEFLEKGLNLRTTNLLINGMELSELTKVELIAISKALHNLGIVIFNPKTYFTESELTGYKEYKHKQEEIEDIITFENCIGNKFGSEYTACYVDINFIYWLVKNRMIAYDFETQRNARLKKLGGGYIRKINVNNKSVEEIKNLYLNGKAFITTLTLNLVGEGDIRYDVDSNSLLIDTREVILTCIDGWHRISGIVKAVEEAKLNNKTLEGYVNINIETYTVDEARNFIFINEKKNAIDKNFTKTLSNDEYNIYAKEINSYGDKNSNPLHGEIAMDYSGHKIQKTKTIQYIIAEALRIAKYEASVLKRKKEISGLIDRVNYIVESIKEETECFNESVFNSMYVYGLYILVSAENDFETLEKDIRLIINSEEKLKALKTDSKDCSMAKINRFWREVKCL